MSTRTILAILVIVLCTTGGCVVRELVIKSDPPGATVYINGRESGKTPLTKTFDFYGARELMLRMDGYWTEKKTVKPSVPWYEFFPLDFFFEIVFPLRLHNRHEYSFKLKPLPDRPDEELLKRADKVRTDEK